MDEEDGSADDDEHIRIALFAGSGEHARTDRPSGEHAANGVGHGAYSGGGGGGGSGVLEKFRIEYPKKYHNVRSMSLSMERNAFCELCRVSRTSVQCDFGSGSGGGGGSGSGTGGSGSGEDGGSGGGGPDDEPDDDGVRRYCGFTLRQYMALGSLALVDFLGFCSMSVMAPTFPKEVILLLFFFFFFRFFRDTNGHFITPVWVVRHRKSLFSRRPAAECYSTIFSIFPTKFTTRNNYKCQNHCDHRGLY